MKPVLILFILTISALSLGALGATLYPVADLGNCADRTSCETYCDDSQHIDACLDYAASNGLIAGEDLADARKIAPLIKSGQTPGKCTTVQSCRTYCDSDANLNECVNFAVNAGIISGEEAEQVKKVGGRGPGNCNSKQACESYCKDSSHTGECVNFAVSHGMMTQEEAEIVKKTGFGPGPGGCASKSDCDSFCNKRENQVTCIEYGKSMGLVDPDEADLAIAAGGMDKETMDNFCNANMENWKRCSAVWVKKGTMTQEQAEETLKYKNAPSLGGCGNEDMECKTAYCNRNENYDECARYEVYIGKMTQAEYDAIKQQMINSEAEKQRIAEEDAKHQAEVEAQLAAEAAEAARMQADMEAEAAARDAAAAQAAQPPA